MGIKSYRDEDWVMINPIHRIIRQLLGERQFIVQPAGVKFG